MDTSDPANPQIVHGFLPRDAEGYQIEETWDTLGMRATQSHDTVLDKAFVADEHVALVCPAGFAGAGLFQVAIFAWALLGFATVYHGVAQRAFDITVERMPKRTSIALTRSMAYHPEVQHYVAEMRMALDADEALLDRSSAIGRPASPTPIGRCGSSAPATSSSTRPTTSSTGRWTCPAARGIFKRNRLEQIFRDVRMGRFHPGNTLLAHELVGKLCLGINPDDPQRWG